MFSERVVEPVKLRLVGAIWAPGNRPVTSVLRVRGTREDRHVQNDHRVLSRAPWPALQGGGLLRRWLVCTFVPTGPVVRGSDETRERRRGEKISATGLSRDPGRSSPAHLGNASGWRWGSRMLLTPMPWATRVWGWPCRTVLSPSAREDQERARAPRPLLDRARQAGWLVRHWRPESALVVVGDSTDAALAWLDSVRHAVCVITRLRLDAALYEPAPPRKPRQNGRPRKKGPRLPTLAWGLTKASTRWSTVTVTNG
jgi:DDE superfamily endonuclease